MARPAKNYIRWRNGSAMVQVQVPADVRAQLGGKWAFTHTLGKMSKCEAANRSLPIVADFLTRIEQATNRKPIGFHSMITATLSPNGLMVPEVLYADQPEAIDWRANRLQVLREELSKLETHSGEAVTLTSILERWNQQKRIEEKLEKDSPSFGKFTGFMAELAESAGTDDATRITGKHITDYETKMWEEGRLGANTIRNKLAAYKALFRFARRKNMITVNPAEDIEVPDAAETDVRDFPPALAKRIVSEAQKLRPELYLAVLVQSVTGCRVSEILNRQTTDISEEEGAVIFEIPKTGKWKGKTLSSSRKIPVHPAIASMLTAHRDAVISQHGNGLLFPTLPRGKDGEAKPSVYGTRVIDEWFRDKLEITEKFYSPNHSWRHTVKTALYKAGVDPKTRDMIIGHGSNVSRKYEHGDVAMMAKAITTTLPDPLA